MLSAFYSFFFSEKDSVLKTFVYIHVSYSVLSLLYVLMIQIHRQIIS